MDKKKYGQYFTKKTLWLMPQIKKFIKSSNCTIAYDPFAGEGDLLNCSKYYNIKDIVGLDIDQKLNWQKNDSLKKIPHIDNAIIITNPPYLTNYSARRKKIINDIEHYFQDYTDLYQLALLKMLEAQEYVVAIIPETFINSKFLEKIKSRLYSITILINNPFEDTENPVCVVCFDNQINKNKKIKIYLEHTYINTLNNIKSKQLIPTNKYDIKFNDISGNLAIRAVDMPNVDKKIKFMNITDLKYDLKNIKNSSRLITVVKINEPISNLEKLISQCNKELEEYRNETMDINLSPFKGNAKDGTRRRRLDYKTARAIIEKSLDKLLGGIENDNK